MSPKKVILEPEKLNAIFIQWLIRNNIAGRPYHGYQNEVRKHNKQFEQWLWSHNGAIVQMNKCRYLQFTKSDDEVLLFLLKYS
jgi:hypothetical protein